MYLYISALFNRMLMDNFTYRLLSNPFSGKYVCIHVYSNYELTYLHSIFFKMEYNHSRYKPHFHFI